MISAQYWNPLQKNLADLLRQKRFEEAIEAAAMMHAMLHESAGGREDSFEDRLWKDLDYRACRILTKKNTTVVWNIWHLTRIEDLIAGIVIADEAQLFNDERKASIGSVISDTGNAMTAAEVQRLSDDIDIDGLRRYRREVAGRTQKILRALPVKDCNRKVRPDQMRRILQEGGVLEDPASKWLLDFWGKKKIGGLLTMPITRHQVVHLNDSFRIKSAYSR